jgi:transcriptional regulator with XRE-family HTH domain
MVLDRMKAAIKLLGYTVRDVEKTLGYSFGYLSRVFSGTIELKMEHIIDISGALQMGPEELLAFVYPTFRDPASEAARELWQRVGGNPTTGAVRQVQHEEVRVEDIERALRQSLGRTLREIGGRLADD